MKQILTPLIKSIARAALLTAAACMVAGKVSAQENNVGELLAGWAVNPLPAGGGTTPVPPTTQDGNLTIGPLTKGSGIGAVTTTGVFGGNAWNVTPNNESNAIAHKLFITYSVAANAGYTVSFTTNVLFFHNSATGPYLGELQYSTDGTNYIDALPITYGPTNTATTAGITNSLIGVPALQNVPSGVTTYFRIVNWGASGSAGTWYVNNPNPVTMPDFQIIGNLSSIGVAPFNLSLTPASASVSAGSTATFTVTAQGDTPTYSWFDIIGGITNPIPSATSSTLTLENVTGGDAGQYYVVLSNATGVATSSVVTLTVADPVITGQPNSAYGLLDGTVQFSVVGAGTAPGYQWYFSDASGNPIAPVANGTQASGSVVSGADTSLLTISNLQLADATNFVAVVANSFGSVTSSVASLFSVSSSAILAFWNFNQLDFPATVTNPAPWFGVGKAFAVGGPAGSGNTFAGSVDPIDGPGFGLGLTNFSWGTEGYPANNATNLTLVSNKLNGIQFNVSTLGAQNISVSYDSRVSATASDYERLQYTTNGVDWIDYPASSSFNGVGTTYEPYSYNLTGFPGADNNPNFGIRIVTEIQSTATYGVSPNAQYLGTANTYGTTGTVTYDIVTVSGDAITVPYAPPTISAISDTNTPDFLPLTLNFTVSDPSTSPDDLTYNAVSLNTPSVSPSFQFGGSGASRTLTITPNSTLDNVDAGPVVVTVTDANGFSAATWFILTLTSVNLPPTNSLASVAGTNVVANSSITIPFKVTDDRTPTNGASFSYSAFSSNSTVVPFANIIVPADSPSSNATVTVIPATNQLGVAPISITVNDNDPVDPKSSTTSFILQVRPNTNVVLIDYFNSDFGGPLDIIGAGFWNHLSGTLRQMQVTPDPINGFVTVDTLDNTENLQATLIGAPYKTNNTTAPVLYASYIVKMDLVKLPIVNGTYFTTFNDGSGTTGNYECRVVSATNGAAAGFYRLGISNFGADATDAQMFPEDLVPGSNYVVVTSLVLSNGQSTLWINPGTQSSPSITDHGNAPSATNLFNISAFELRESGTDGGAVALSHLKVGTTFDSVFPSLQISNSTGSPVLTWSDPTLPIQSATSVTGPYQDLPGITSPYTNNPATSDSIFFRFKQ